MKTLDQVEPRTPIPGGNVAPTISASGSYYLSGNLYRTLTISASNVTLDLMGFTIDPSSGGAIMIGSSLKNLTVRNGILTGAEIGIDARSLRESNSRFEKLTVSACSDIGLYIGSGCIVEDCVVNACGNYGIFSSNDGKLEVRNCRITGTTLNGVVSADGSRIIGNTIEGSGANGLRLIGTNSYVIGNIVIGNVDNYDFAQGNQLNLLLGEIPEALDWPCSVKFAGTLNTTQTGTNGITVNADDVTIDMAGHALVGPGANSGSGIYQAGHYRNLRVFNGKVVEWRGNGTGGVFVFGSSVHLSDMQVTTNNSGIVVGKGSTLSACTAQNNASYGIYANGDSTLSDCTAQNNASYGIYADAGSTLSRCSAQNNNFVGINVGSCSALSGCVAQYTTGHGILTGNGCTLSDCMGQNNTIGYGILTGHGSTLSRCTALNNAGSGIYTGNGCTLSNCAAQYNAGVGVGAGDGSTLSSCAAQHNSGDGIVAGAGNTLSICTAQDNTGDGIVAGGNSTLSECASLHNTGDGIQITQNSRIVGCICSNNGFSFADNSAGIHATLSKNRIEGNTCMGSDRGIDVDSVGNFIARNTCSNNALNWDVVAGNVCLVVNATTAGAISGNSGGAALGSADPNANFTY